MSMKHANIKHWGMNDLIYEEAYNTYAGRFFPFEGVPEPEWGGAWVAIDPGETSTKHSHLEKEIFFVIAGNGVLRIGDDEQPIEYGDTVYVTPGIDHDIVNTGDERLVFLDVWWDTPESEKVDA
jgi:mannose-6-phosphate isomerase-like protein (cupin superfamily)